MGRGRGPLPPKGRAAKCRVARFEHAFVSFRNALLFVLRKVFIPHRWGECGFHNTRVERG